MFALRNLAFPKRCTYAGKMRSFSQLYYIPNSKSAIVQFLYIKEYQASWHSNILLAASLLSLTALQTAAAEFN